MKTTIKFLIALTFIFSFLNFKAQNTDSYSISFSYSGGKLKLVTPKGEVEIKNLIVINDSNLKIKFQSGDDNSKVTLKFTYKDGSFKDVNNILNPENVTGNNHIISFKISSKDILKKIRSLSIQFFDKSNNPLGAEQKIVVNPPSDTKNVPLNNSSSDKKSKATGSILYDAMFLEKNQNGSNLQLVLDILSTYSNEQLSKDNLDTNYQLFKNNRFLKEYITKIKSNSNVIVQQNGSDAISGGISSLTSSLGGLDVTNIADGFAKFIVKRTKQELSIAFFDKFKQSLDSVPDLQTVFPQTYRALKSIDQDIYMFQAYIQTLRESFEKDLASLPSNLPSIIDNHENFFKNMPELKAELQSGFYIAQSIQDKQHPGDIIENYPSDYWKESNPNYQAAFNTLKLFSKSLKDSVSIESYWASYTDIKKLSNDNSLLKIYLGLLELQAKTDSIVFKTKVGTDVLFSKIIDDAYNDYTQYKSFITNISLKTKLLESKIQGLKKVKNDSLLFENYYSVISSSLDLMKFSLTAQKLPHFPALKVDLDTVAKKYFDIAQTSCDMAIDVNRRNYSSAIVNAIHLYDVIFKKENLTIYINGLDANIKKGEVIKYSSGKFENAAKLFFKYGSFIATIVQAKNSDDIASAIEAFALPTGSARIKRESLFNVSINAYAGGFIGYEQIKGADKPWASASQKLNTYGIAAPIGISINLGARKFFWMGGPHWSYSVFVSVVDIGAIVAFRFQNDSVAQIPTIKLKDIISPGLFLSIGIPKSPISINFGAQAGPNLRSVGVTTNSYANSSYVRYSASILVDLPILNLYTKPRD